MELSNHEVKDGKIVRISKASMATPRKYRNDLAMSAQI